jgi:uncharacterized protein YkwD
VVRQPQSHIPALTFRIRQAFEFFQTLYTFKPSIGELIMQKLLHLTFASGVLAMLTACGGGGSDTTSSSTGTTTNSASIPVADCGLPDFKNEVLSRLNAYRASGLTCGTEVMSPTTPVVWNEQLQQAATAHATDMANNNYISHTGLNGSTIIERQNQAGFNTSGQRLENLAAAVFSVEAAMKSWRESPAHCKGMMLPAIRQIAVSCAANPASDYKFYWAMEGGA